MTDDRVLPHNLEAELSVLGAILIHNDAFDRTHALLKPSHFYREAHRRLFKSMIELQAKNVPIEFVTLKNELDRTGELDEVGGPAYISALVDGLPHAVNVQYYAAIVREKWLLREMINAGNKLVAGAYEAVEPADLLLREADRTMLGLQLQLEDRGMLTMASRSGDLMADLEQLVANKGQLLGIDTGFKSINEQTMGWQDADLIIIAARPSIGKTAFVLNSGLAAAKLGMHVGIFSLEMRRRQLERRMLSFLSGVPLSKIQSGYLAEADYKGISAALCALDNLPLYISDRSGQTIGDIRTACRRLRSEHGLDLVIIDYLQLMPGSLERRGATRNEELGDISSRLKWLADELAVPVIALSQLKRLGHSRPSLEDLRDSGNLEQDADLVCFLHRKNHKESGVTNFILEKQRNGPTGTVNLSIDRDIQLFTDAGEQTEEQASAATAEEDHDAKTRAIIRARSKRR